MIRILPPTYAVSSPALHHENAGHPSRYEAKRAPGWPHVTRIIKAMVWLLLLIVVPLGKAEPIEPSCNGPYKDKKLDREKLLALGFLQRAKFELCEADLSKLDLDGISLSNGNLVGTKFIGAYLRWTILEGANLSGADFTLADLSYAWLDEANLIGAKFGGADLTGVRFTPKLGLPDITGMAFARNLRLMITYEGSRPMLSELREAFKKAGFRQSERDMTYLLRKLDEDRALKEHSYLEYLFNRGAFRLTCNYGASPGRPLWILFWMFVFLSLIYLYALTRSGRGALWAVWSPDRIQQSEGQKDPVRLSYARPFPPNVEGGLLPPYLAAPRPCGLGRVRGATTQLFGAWLLALYFSLLSALHFGWPELNVSNWIARIQPREYTIRATGWVRVVSGLQSLLSLCLIALWVLSYFGRPFDN